MTEEVKFGVKPIVLGGALALMVALGIIAFLPDPQLTQEPMGDVPEHAVDEEPSQAAEVVASQAEVEVQSQVVEDLPLPAVEEAPAPVAEEAPVPVVEEVPMPAVVEVPEPVVEEVPVQTDVAISEPAEVLLPEQDEIAPEPEPEVAEPAPEPAPEVAAQSPSVPLPSAGPQFDTFRVDPDGGMVIAGRAEPWQVVDVILAGQALERVTADGNGTFVALPFAGPSDQPRRLFLLADPDGAAIASEVSYIVAPIAAPVIVAAAAPEPEVESEEQTTVEDAAEEQVAPLLPEADPAPEAVVIVDGPAPAPLVLQADADGVRVVQDTTGAVAENVALDAITYDPEGDVQLAGRAVGDGAVQVYLDNEPLMTSSVEEGGDWQIELPEIETGIYTLRIDEVDEEGTVVSRMETPFKREEREEVAAALAEETTTEGFEVAVKTVQPGSTLWAIAEENLGAGIYYVEIFEANSDLIRDPDLIYPGQIFRIPEVPE